MVRATRNRKPTNYALDPYKDLDSDDSAQPGQLDDSSEDEDFLVGKKAAGNANVPSGAEEGEDGEGDEEYLSGLGDGDDPSDPQGGKPPRARSRSAPIETSGEGTRLHRTHQFRVGRVSNVPPGIRRRDRLAKPVEADRVVDADTPATMRPPDPSVKITYRPGFIKSTGKRERIVTAYGGSIETLVKAVRVRDQYIGLPAVPERPCLGFTPFWSESQDVIVNVGMGKQRSQRIEYYDAPGIAGGGGGSKHVEKYLPAETGFQIKCLIGPSTGKKIITFQRFGMHDLAGTGKGKKGFILNAGGHVLGMDWAPNRSKGWQYLAISTKSDNPYSPTPPTSLPGNDKPLAPPAFDRAPSPSCIQIWRFPADEAGSPAGAPSLALALCHDWGPATGMRWCQVPKEPESDKDLGLLGAVFRDGKVRILRIVLPDDDTDGDCIFVKLEEPAFECGLDDTICTTMAWISDHEIVAGCANGAIACWSLPQALDPEIEFTPYIYTLIHQTYIAQLSTCYPSFPTHIVSASLDGYCRLTSLLDPYTDTVVNNRSRIAPTTICWVDAVNAAVSCEEGAWVKFYPLRRFFSATTVCKHNGVVSSVSGSMVHSFVVSGGSEGECTFSNPVRRTFHGKIKNYQQTWFHLEYSKESNMFRMSEGFKLEEFETKSEKMKRRQNNTALVHSTAFPEESNITQVCWNPNKIYGGWATAGSACGLVRVEDVAIDA